MCLICQILAEQEAARKGEIGITTAAQEGQVSSSIQQDQDRASINLTNAEAVRKLAETAQILEDIHQDAAAKRVVDLINHLVPAQPEPGPIPDKQASDEEASKDVTIKILGASGTGKSFLSGIVLSALTKKGFSANLDDAGVDTIVVADPASTIRNKQPGSNPNSADARNDRISRLLEELEAEGVMLVGAFDTKLA